MNIIAKGRKGHVFSDNGYRFGPKIEALFKEQYGRESSRGVGYHHPSSLAGCPRMLYYCRAGIKGRENTTSNMRLRMNTGTHVHHQLNEYVADIYPDEVAQTDVPLSMPSMHLGGEADMIVWNTAVVDFKTAATKSFGKVRPVTISPEGDIKPASMKGYVWQVHAYMAMADIPMAVILYYNKDNSRILEIPVPFNIKVWEQIEEKIDSIEVAVETGEIPDREISPFFCKNLCSYLQECKPEL